MTIERRGIPAGAAHRRHVTRLEAIERQHRAFAQAVDILRAHYVRYARKERP